MIERLKTYLNSTEREEEKWWIFSVFIIIYEVILLNNSQLSFLIYNLQNGDLIHCVQ